MGIPNSKLSKGFEFTCNNHQHTLQPDCHWSYAYLNPIYYSGDTFMIMALLVTHPLTKLQSFRVYQ